MTNNSASGGYLQPKATAALPKGLTLTQFIQTVLVGVSNLPGTLVRPSWQVAPPQQPDIATNWMAYAIVDSAPDANSSSSTALDGVTTSQRHYELEINCSIYGPDAVDNSTLISDGFQIQQNLETLRSANMGFKEVSRAQHIPDLLNERWVNRVTMSIFLRRQIIRVYPILPILSAAGTIHTVVGDEQYLLDFKA